MHSPSMRSFLLFFLLSTGFITSLSAQIKVFKGSSTYSGDILCTVSQGKDYSSTSTYRGDVLCTLRDGKIYEGTSPYSGDVLYTLRDGKIYSENSSYSGDIVWTLKEGKIYKGSSSYSGDVLATRKDRTVYRGNSTYSGDILFTLDRARPWKNLLRFGMFFSIPTDNQVSHTPQNDENNLTLFFRSFPAPRRIFSARGKILDFGPHAKPFSLLSPSVDILG
ncbi:MAG: hypothetical protein O3A40_10060 [Bacteroidetes bacterium]|nr:hypothetical protein [Bacteroidota bacterium]